MDRPVSHVVESVTFGFLGKSEVLALSTVRVTSPELTDSLGHPVRFGLSDLRMGPADQGQACATCGLPGSQCPGHLGHISLSVPLYNTLLFPALFRLIKCKCLHCHYLRVTEEQERMFLLQMRLLSQGRLKDAIAVAGEAAAAQCTELTSAIGEAPSPDAVLNKWEASVVAFAAATTTAAAGKQRHAHAHGAHELVFRKELVSALLADVKPKCPRCGVQAGKIRRDGHSKIFVPLHCRDVLVPCDDRAAAGEDEAVLVAPPPGKSKSKSKSKAKATTTTTTTTTPAQVQALPYSTADAEAQQRAAVARALETAAARKQETADHKLLLKEVAAQATRTGTGSTRLLFPNEAVRHMELLWEKQPELMANLYGPNYEMFFVVVVPVPPPRFRPDQNVGGITSLHPQTVRLQSIVKSESVVVGLLGRPEPDMDAVLAQWLSMQSALNLMMDSDKSGGGGGSSGQVAAGIRQVIERKQGLFRRHMMGKRVNFAARTVISPDPNILTSEIGVPEIFARKLTYPEPVTPFNVEQLRQAVINGQSAYPGAAFVEDEAGHRTNLAYKSQAQRVALANTLLTPSEQPRRGQVKKVERHLRTGDVLLVNRQPTLHKPSMMAHRARVLSGQNTIRMHYANCSTYNADFDGDEMNLHFPQSELARAEAYNLANTDNQYVKPTDGMPLRGLIQDHVGIGALLTKRDTFFTRGEFQQLVLAALPDAPASDVFVTPPPAVVRPRRLWTGKQLVSVVLRHVVRGVPLNMTSRCKVPAASWGPSFAAESVCEVRGGELVQGVLDKSQFGASAYGLVHYVHELCGPVAAGTLLSVLGRLFTAYLQVHGFTCGLEDMLLVPESDRRRQELVGEAAVRSLEASAAFAGLEIPPGLVPGGPVADAVNRSLAGPLQARRRADPADAGAKLDASVKGAVNPVTSKIIDACLAGGAGTRRPFPLNNLLLMVQSGAKGSMVNVSQMTCLLGQQELEGRRVPVMASGRTLPSFRPYDATARAGGYVTDRFLTGIRPQEYYFHCMAGREGLVDTAVKTSNSGYLQRCLIKGLESLVVAYDQTVRDSDGSVVQFLYGDDSVDVARCAFLERFDFFASNYQAMLRRLDVGLEKVSHLDTSSVELHKRKEADAKKKKKKEKEKKDDKTDGPDGPATPLLALFNPGVAVGAVSERFAGNLDAWLSKRAAGQSPSPDAFRQLMYLYYMRCLVSPGESVGILAAQSVGEPSTQMTLNTFHLAGHGGANVTLGIPRLKEIIMTASCSISTPLMELPVRGGRAEAEQVARQLGRVRLVDFVESLSVAVSTSATRPRRRLYVVAVGLPDMKDPRVRNAGIVSGHIVDAIEWQVVPGIARQLGYRSPLEDDEEGQTGRKRKTKTKVKGEEEEEEEQEEEGEEQEEEHEEEDDGRKNKNKKKKKKADDEEEASAGEESSEEEEEEGDDDDDEEEEEEEEDEEEEKEEEAGKEDDEEDKMKEDKEEVTRESKRKLRELYPVLDKIVYSDRKVEMTFALPLEAPKILMLSHATKAVERAVLRRVPGIGECFVVERRREEGRHETEFVVQAAGSNFESTYGLTAVDHQRIRSNDIGAILRTFGVEAARAAIVREIAGVFDVYGISVSKRHLGLLADYMTFAGGFRPLSRTGMRSCPSLLQKITFETSTSFMVEASTYAESDPLTAPSSRIVFGRPVRCGTGYFDLMQPLQ